MLDLHVILDTGTLAVVVLVVIITSSLATFLCLFLWARTAPAQELHCGHCHSLLALQGVPLPPETVPLQLPLPRSYVTNSALPSQQLPSASNQFRYQSASLGRLGHLSRPGYENESITLTTSAANLTLSNITPEPELVQPGSLRVRFPVDLTNTSASKMTLFSKQSDSIIVHSKYPFHRTCSTRKKVLPKYRCPPNSRDSYQPPKQHWLDISQMCRTVLSKISPRQRLSKSRCKNSYQSNSVEEIFQQVAPSLVHNYIHPLNDVQRYNALVLETNIQNPSSPYGYLTSGGEFQQNHNQNSAANRRSWGSTLPEYNEFLI